jgi:outer membrane protein OmpA-like peptidoglycan-associated protein
VVRYLVTRGGIPADRLQAKGYGETQPLIPDANTEDGHAINRRVEFHIVEEKAGSADDSGDGQD